jgi:ribonuclease P protein component
MKFTLGKQERLKSKKIIEQLYQEGKTVKVFPLRMVYLKISHTSDYPAQVGVSVPKRNFKLAVHRNRLKRLMRESYRLQKNIIYNNIEGQYVFMISYLGKEMFVYNKVHEKMKLLLEKFVNETKKSPNEEK